MMWFLYQYLHFYLRHCLPWPTAATGAICHAQRWVSTGTQAAVKSAVVTVATLAVLDEVVRVSVRDERISMAIIAKANTKLLL